MHLSEIQKLSKDFELERGWERFPSSLVFVHLIEELGEIGRFITYKEGYKASGLGHHVKKRGLGREFAQAFSLFIQLANRFEIDLEKEFKKELRLMEKRFKAEDWREYMSNYTQKS
ncbi:MAG: MazG-like family protein [Nitrososphaerota archaeon]|nr:MazG-like family protein [Nitrososphaerales archaeon]MDW8044465.1 MazG-like family protein [Nitrososphaerota archaeon]